MPCCLRSFQSSDPRRLREYFSVGQTFKIADFIQKSESEEKPAAAGGTAGTGTAAAEAGRDRAQDDSARTFQQVAFVRAVQQAMIEVRDSESCGVGLPAL